MQAQGYSDPAGRIYIEKFADAEEEAAWNEQAKRIMNETTKAPEAPRST